MRTMIAVSLFVGLAGCGGNGGTPSHDLSVAADLTSSMNNDDLSMSSMDDLTMSGGNPDLTPCKGPSMLYPEMVKGKFYCPFGKTDAGSLYCTAGVTHCCEPAAGTSSCDPVATPCGGGDTDWLCEEAGDCPAQMVCCGSGTLVQDMVCGSYATGFHGTHCAATCVAGEIQMCTATAQCSNNKTCIPFRTKGNQVGGCG